MSKKWICDNNVIHTSYDLVYESSCDSSPIRVTFSLFVKVPAFLSPWTFLRYRMNRNDIVATLEKWDTIYLLQMHLVYSQTVNPSETRKVLIETLIDKFALEHVFHARPRSVLCTQRIEHRPLLPKVKVPRITWSYWAARVLPHPPGFQMEVNVEEGFQWRGIVLIPKEKDDNFIYMARVIPQALFEAIRAQCPPKLCMMTLPVRVTIGSDPYVLTDEACFLCVKRGKKRKNE